MHNKLANYRLSDNWEFFKYPLNEAIILLQQLKGDSHSEFNYQAIDIMGGLTEKYPNALCEDIVDVRIVQPKERVWLEITTELSSSGGDTVDQTIKRSDLAFIIDDGLEDDECDLYFRSEDPVQVNAMKFLNEFDEVSIAMTTDLFKDSASHKVIEKHNKNKQ